MTTLQCLSHLEQMEAVRRDFHIWFNRNVKPVLDEQNATHFMRGLSMDTHWQAWRKQAEAKRKAKP